MISDAGSDEDKYKILYKPKYEQPHICYLPNVGSVMRGTVAQCKICGQIYFNKKSLLWEGYIWAKVRWWNFSIRRKIG